jgi:hypothetical protein
MASRPAKIREVINLFNSLGREVFFPTLVGDAPVGGVDAGELILRISSFESRDGTRTV